VATPLVLLGAGDRAREIVDVLAACRAAGSVDYELVGYLVEPPYGQPGTVVDGLPILGDLGWLNGRERSMYALSAVGSPALRWRFSSIARSLGVRFATLVHPTVLRSSRVDLGEGVVVDAGCILTKWIRIGDHSQVDIGCTLSHGVTLADHVTLSPGVHLAGDVTVESGCFVGIGACVIPRRRLGAWSTLGAGCTVIHDVAPNSTVVGVPGRQVKVSPAGWHEEGISRQAVDPEPTDP
jgi:sugar O-acyltransferase (sialic acid O-acetyltransferase NeuD family)